MQKIIVTGGRDFTDYKFLVRVLCNYRDVWSTVLIIHGDCEGADKMSDSWAKAYLQPVVPFPATDEMWNLMDNQAGNVRNHQMLIGNTEAIVAAFPGPKSRGTFNCMNDAARLGMQVDLFRPGFADQFNWSRRTRKS